METAALNYKTAFTFGSLRFSTSQPRALLKLSSAVCSEVEELVAGFSPSPQRVMDTSDPTLAHALSPYNALPPSIVDPEDDVKAKIDSYLGNYPIADDVRSASLRTLDQMLTFA